MTWKALGNMVVREEKTKLNHNHNLSSPMHTTPRQIYSTHGRKWRLCAKQFRPNPPNYEYQLNWWRIYVYYWTRPSLVRVMACRLFGIKPLPQTTLTHCKSEASKHFPGKFHAQMKHFRSAKYISNYIWFVQRQPFNSVLDVSTWTKMKQHMNMNYHNLYG